MKKYLLSIGKLILLFLCLLIYLLIGEHFNIFLACPIYTITHLYCPGCGVTRMLLSILHGNFKAAFSYNPLLFISLPFFIIYYLDYLIAKLKLKKPKFQVLEPYIWYFLLGIFLIYGILRNIPYFDILKPTIK